MVVVFDTRLLTSLEAVVTHLRKAGVSVAAGEAVGRKHTSVIEMVSNSLLPIESVSSNLVQQGRWSVRARRPHARVRLTFCCSGCPAHVADDAG